MFLGAAFKSTVKVKNVMLKVWCRSS